MLCVPSPSVLEMRSGDERRTGGLRKIPPFPLEYRAAGLTASRSCSGLSLPKFLARSMIPHLKLSAARKSILDL
jgi:hypothetical protein